MGELSHEGHQSDVSRKIQKCNKYGGGLIWVSPIREQRRMISWIISRNVESPDESCLGEFGGGAEGAFVMWRLVVACKGSGGKSRVQ